MPQCASKFASAPGAGVHRARRAPNRTALLRPRAVATGRAINWKNAPNAKINAKNTLPTQMTFTPAFGRRRPIEKHQRRRPQREQRDQPDMRQKIFSWHATLHSSAAHGPLPFQNIHFIRQHRLAIAEERDDDAQAHRGFGRRIGDDEDGENLPSTEPTSRENATRLMFTAFRISSTDIRMMITLRRVTTPITPIVNSARLKNR